MEMKQFAINNELATLTKKLATDSVEEKKVGNESIILFFSFDVVNSTFYKTANKDKWMDVIHEILSHIISAFANSSEGGYRFWKTLGDEIIYTKEVSSMDDVITAVETIYGKMRNLNDEIASGKLCDMDSAKILGIKATAWIADISNSGSTGDNIYTEYLINDNRRQTEYLGPDIDCGFRVSGHSLYNHMAISFELACLLMKFDQKKGKRVHLYAFKQLKGVWEGRPYPILMFNGDSKADLIGILKEEHSSKKENKDEYLANLDAWNTDINHSDEVEIQTIAKEMNLDEKIERMVRIICQGKVAPHHGLKPFSKVHYTALCYQKTDGVLRFMLAKKKEENEWGFGGNTMYHTYSYIATIKQQYQDSFGVDIGIINDQKYLNYTPLVLFSYTQFVSNDISQKGTTFLAEIKTDLNDVQTSSDWDVLFLSEDEISNLQEPKIKEFDEIFKKGLDALSL